MIAIVTEADIAPLQLKLDALQEHLQVDFIAAVTGLKCVPRLPAFVEPPSSGGDCCICDQPITEMQSYGVSARSINRFHWTCLKSEASKIPPPVKRIFPT